MAFLSALWRSMTAAAQPAQSSPRDLTKFDVGVCPGCRGLRTVASLRCLACGNLARVTADA